MSEATAQVSQIIDAEPATIWKALTDPKKLKTFFMGSDVESDWRVGSPIRFRGEFKGKPYEDKGEIQTVEVEHRLSFSHFSPLTGEPDRPENYHVVTFDLEPTEKKTRVTLTQSNLIGRAKKSDVDHRAEYEKNWTSVLDGLKKVVEKH
jgi:uncharacterized protein YndB with AHSA1/START domain